MTAPYFEFPADSLPVTAPRQAYADYGKRAFDIAAVLVMAPMILPLMAILIALVWASGGQPLYVQPRVGRDGRIFHFWKIRTMVPNAEAALARLLNDNPALALEWSVKQKLSTDPRVTFIGRMLRKTSLDELPQIWNVLRGDMSLVGPRPFTPDQTELYPCEGTSRAAYLALRPGITGLWQVSRRNRGSFAERARYDGEYANSLSFFGDLQIMVRTVAVVFCATGL
ncbi:MAG TPA: sugar transferase [Albidovulum sp.]|uniref:sugar transferase n=1 Tax=Albidovulum sp. TaxID=1872424 RepID=UPI002C4FD2A7|nr:sugar transferase [Albidovulum sp.]